jgi:hypothetical protein
MYKSATEVIAQPEVLPFMDFSEDRGEKIYAALLLKVPSDLPQLPNAVRPGRPQDDVGGPRPA